MSVLINGKTHELNAKSKTHLNNLDLIFAVLLSDRGEFKSDEKSLLKLACAGENVSLWVNSSVGAVGELLAYAEHSELSEDCLRSVGWLLTGLSELQYLLNDANVCLDESLRKLEAKQLAIKNPVTQ